MWGGGTSQVMSYDTNSLVGHVRLCVCICVTRWYTSQYSGTIGLSPTNQITGQMFAVMRLASDLVASKIINQTAYRAEISVHM